MTRFLLALHATLPAALVAAVLLHFRPPAGLPPLAERPVWATWALIGWWLLSSAVAGWALRGATLWKVTLTTAGGLLALAAVVGWVLGAALAPAMPMALLAVATVFMAVAASIGPAQVQLARRGKKHGLHGAPTAGADARKHSGRRSARNWQQHGRRLAAHWPFWLAAMLAVESFRLAHIVATGAARPSGMAGLLLACLVALPAATLRIWMPRTSALLWWLAAAAFAGLAFKAGLVQWALAAALCTLAALSGPLQRWRRHFRRRIP